MRMPPYTLGTSRVATVFIADVDLLSSSPALLHPEWGHALLDKMTGAR